MLCAVGVKTQPMDTFDDTTVDVVPANLEQPQQYTQTPAAQVNRLVYGTPTSSNAV